MTAAVCSSRRVKRETSSLLPAAGGSTPSSPVIQTLTANGSGGVTMTWLAPLTKGDGSAIDTITAYTIYHGTTDNQQYPGGSGTTPVAAGTGTSHTFTTSTGARKFAITATNAAGEGNASQERPLTVT